MKKILSIITVMFALCAWSTLYACGYESPKFEASTVHFPMVGLQVDALGSYHPAAVATDITYDETAHYRQRQNSPWNAVHINGGQRYALQLHYPPVDWAPD